MDHQQTALGEATDRLLTCGTTSRREARHTEAGRGIGALSPDVVGKNGEPHIRGAELVERVPGQPRDAARPRPRALDSITMRLT